MNKNELEIVQDYINRINELETALKIAVEALESELAPKEDEL